MAYQIRMKDEDTRAKAFECRDACHRARVQMPELTGGREWESPFGEGKSGERGTPFGGSLLPPSLSLSVSQCAELCNSLSVSLSLVFFGSSSLLRTDSGWSFIRLPIQGGRVHYCGWNITGGMRRNLVCFFFLFFIRAWTSFFFFFSLPFLEVCLDREFEQPCFNFVSKFGEVFLFFFLFVAASRTTVWISFLFFNGEVGCSKKGCTANQSGTIFFERFDSMSYYIK